MHDMANEFQQFILADASNSDRCRVCNAFRDHPEVGKWITSEVRAKGLGLKGVKVRVILKFLLSKFPGLKLNDVNIYDHFADHEGITAKGRR